MNAITPENEMPPAQSTAASGTLPIEQTNASVGDERPNDDVLEEAGSRPAHRSGRAVEELIGRSATLPAIRSRR